MVADGQLPRPYMKRNLDSSRIQPIIACVNIREVTLLGGFRLLARNRQTAWTGADDRRMFGQLFDVSRRYVQIFETFVS